MSPKNGQEKIQINNSSDLKQRLVKLGLKENINVPEFNQVLEFTHQELLDLKNQISTKNENEVFVIIENFIKNKAKATLDAQKATASSLTGMKTAQFREGMGNQSPEKMRQGMLEGQKREIESIDINKSLEKQTNQIHTFESGVAVLIQDLAIKGTKKETLINPESFKTFLNLKLNELDVNQKIVANKILEVLNSNSKLKDYFITRWSGVVENAFTYIKDINEIAKSQKDGTPISDDNGIMGFAKEHPIMSGLIATAGAYGLYKVIGSFFGGDDSKTEGAKSGEKGFLGGMFDKFFDKIPGGSSWKWILGGVLGIFGLGKTLEIDGVKKFFGEKLGFNIDDNRLTKALQLFSDGKIWEAVKTLVMGVETKLSDKYLDQVCGDLGELDGKKTTFEPAVIKGVLKQPAKEYLYGSAVGAWASIGLKVFGKKGWDKLAAQELKFKDLLKTKIAEKDIKGNETIEDILPRIFSDKTGTLVATTPILPEAGVAAAAVAAGAGAVALKGAEKPGETSEQSTENTKKWPGMEILMGHAATGQDRTLASGVLEYAAKTKYYDGVYRSYVKYKSGFDIGGHRLHILDSMQKYSHELGVNRGSFASMYEVEKNGGLQGLLAKLQQSKNPTEIKNLKVDIDAFLKNSAKFERDFELYIRNAKLEKKVFNSTTYEAGHSIDRFETLREEEKLIGREIHEVSAKFETQAKDLRQKAIIEKWPAEKLASEESKLRGIFAETLHGEAGFMTKLRDVQKNMMGELRIISETDSHHATSFTKDLEGKGALKKKILPGGKLGWTLIGITAGSVLLTGVKDKEKLAYMGAEMVGAFIPGVNMTLDARQIYTGRDLAGDNLAGWERWGLAPAFLVLDTVGSLASLTGIGYAGQAAISSAKIAVRGGKMAKGAAEAKGAIKVAEAGHAAEGLAKETKIFEAMKTMGIETVGTAKEMGRVPFDFMNKYREGMHVAHSSGILKAAAPLASVCKFAVYGSIGYSVFTGLGAIGDVVVDKTKSAMNFFGSGKADNNEAKAA